MSANQEPHICLWSQLEKGRPYLPTCKMPAVMFPLCVLCHFPLLLVDSPAEMSLISSKFLSAWPAPDSPSQATEGGQQTPSCLLLLHSSHQHFCPGSWTSALCSSAATHGRDGGVRPLGDQGARHPEAMLTAESQGGRRPHLGKQDKSFEIFSCDLCSKERVRESSYCCQCKLWADWWERDLVLDSASSAASLAQVDLRGARRRLNDDRQTTACGIHHH